MRQYLLGRLAEADVERVELRLLTDDFFSKEFGDVESELIDQYADGDLPAEERTQFEQYFLKAPERKDKLAFTMALRKAAGERLLAATSRPETPRAARTALPSFYLKAAAVVIIVSCAVLAIWLLSGRRPGEERWIADLRAAYKKQRLVEARITSLDYAPLTRGPVVSDVDEVALRRLELQLLKDLDERPDAESQHALGRFYLAGRQFDKAIERLEAALKQKPDDARINSDLGAALLERGHELEGRDGAAGEAFASLARSLEHLNKALRADPNLLEALYNRALCLHYMKAPEQAKEAWQTYLAHDPQSRWAEEARRNLQTLSARGGSPPTASRLLEEFLAAFRARDDESAWQVMSRNRESITGKMIPPQLEYKYITLKLGGDDESAQESLRALLYAGELEMQRGGDPYTTELARYYAASSAARRKLLAEALENLAQGYRLCLDGNYREATRRFEQALSLFNEADDAWEAKLAEYWISYCHTQADRINESIVLLRSVADFCLQRNFKWLLAQAYNWLATNHAILSQHSDAINYDQQSLALADSISDTYLTQKVLTELGNEYAYLRQPQLSLKYLYRSLTLASQSAGSPRQTSRNFSYTAAALFAFRYYEAAAVFVGEALRGGIDDPSITYMMHLRLGYIYNKLRRFDDAVEQVELGLQTAQSVQDEASRQKFLAASFLTRANVWRENGDHERAAREYDKAIELYERMEFNFYSYAAYKGRLLCSLARGDDEGVRRDLPLLLQLAERYRARIHEEQNRISFFDDEQNVYDLAVEYEHRRRDDVRAFDYAEASHGRSLLDALAEAARIEETAVGTDLVASQVTSPSSLEELRGRLPERVRVVMYTVLPTKLLVWNISREGFDLQEQAISAESLEADVQAYVEALKEGREGTSPAASELGAKLYKTLLGSVAQTFSEGQLLCLIPDKFLNYLPFAALVSPESGRYLAEDYPIFYAPSLNVMLSCSENARRKARQERGTALSVGNPAFDPRDYPGLPRLQSAEREASGVANLFPGRSIRLLGPEATKENVLRSIPSAEIIHFAGHYVMDESNPLRSRMLLAAQGAPGHSAPDSALAAAEILGQRFERTKLIVLSACQTGLDKYYNGEGAVGLSRSFIGAKIPLVVASQWSVDSDGTADLMLSFHKYRQTGLSTVEALRRAQVEMMHGPDQTYRSPYYWAAFLCVGGYAEY